jgi:hypothetical protein
MRPFRLWTGSKLKAMAPMPSSPGGGEGAGVAAAHPDRRMADAVGLGQDVVRFVGTLEELAVEGVIALFPHAHDLGGDLVPHLLGLGGVQVEGLHLVLAGAATGAELEAALGDVVEHGHALGVAHRVVDRRDRLMIAEPRWMRSVLAAT